MESLREDLDIILEARVPESEDPSAEPGEDTVLASLFSIATMPPPPRQERENRHRNRDEEDSRAQKKESHEFAAARRASLIDEEAR